MDTIVEDTLLTYGPDGVVGLSGQHRLRTMIFGNKIMTPRLILRRVTEEDLPLLVDWSNSDMAHGKYLTPDRMDMQTGRENILAGTFWRETSRLFIIELKQQEPIGTLHYWLRSGQGSCAVMSIKICNPDHRNRGYGTEAQKYMIIHLFTRMKLQTLEMYTDIRNKPEQQCLAGLGFEQVETLSYDDQHVKRLGHLYRIKAEAFAKNPVYHYYYEV